MKVKRRRLIIGVGLCVLGLVWLVVGGPVVFFWTWSIVGDGAIDPLAADRADRIWIVYLVILGFILSAAISLILLSFHVDRAQPPVDKPAAQPPSHGIRARRRSPTRHPSSPGSSGSAEDG